MNTKQTRRLCRDFLEMWKGKVFDAPSAASLMRELWGVRVDWHEMAYALDEMDGCGLADRTGERGPDGMTRYIIN
jgi:hypothetical protein